MNYTESQRKGILANEGNYLINAGGGSGKTRVFITRIARMIKDGTATPDEVLGLTFTKDAAEEMRKRLVKAIGKEDAKNVHLSTFHSFAYGILKKKYPDKYNRVKIMPQWWKMKVLNDFCSKSSNYNPGGMDLPCKAGDLATFISRQKLNLVQPGDELFLDMYTEGVATVAKDDLEYIYAKYCDMAEKARMVEFDDMLLDLYLKLEENDTLVRSIQNQYTYIMIDETQDTNIVSMEIIKYITTGNLFVVGDFRQSIYGFNNAYINNILDFDQEFDDVQIIDLEQNFRSTKNIVGLANKLIDKSPNPKYKKFKSQESGRDIDGSPIKFTVYRDSGFEAIEIANKIQDMVDDGKYAYEDFAILLRTNAQLGIYESIFTEQEIPVDVSSDKSFFDRREIADLIAYAQHTVDPYDDLSFRRVYNSPNRFISNANQAIIDEFAFKHELTLEQAAIEAGTSSSRALSSYISIFEDLRDDYETKRADSFLIEVYKRTGYKEHIERTSMTTNDMEMRLDAIQSLFNIAKKFRNINAFLAHLIAVKQNDSRKNEHAVKLLTVHASKGLEFEYVFVPAFSDQFFPHDMNPDIEEERRLSYVACTRAKNHLEISMPNFVSDGGGEFNPSPFLIDLIGDEILEMKKDVTRGDKRSVRELAFA